MKEDGCYACENNARSADLPPRESVLVWRGWRVAHAFNSSVPGWLVLVPLRHVERFADLTDEEVSSFAPVVRSLSRALQDELGCAKTYLAVFGEHIGFEHLHAHVIPRMPELDAATWGTFVFDRLDVPEADWVPEAKRDTLALALRRRLESLI
jgi:diadenosine tetraphosphate (Ap4A) HIT family hydrolase